MSKKPEIKIYPDYVYGVGFPERKPLINFSSKKEMEIKDSLNEFLENSKGWPDDSFDSVLDGAKKQALYHVLKAMLERDPNREDFDKVEELSHNRHISMMCYEGRPFAFCEWQEVKESEVPHVWITPTKYFKDES